LTQKANEQPVTILGAGLAGCEAAWQLALRGIPVRLIEMKPGKFSPAHKLAGPAELVCSNSLGSDSKGSAGAMLKVELRALGSLILTAAEEARVPAGSALAVDREKMCRVVDQALNSRPEIERIEQEAVAIPEGPVIVATGPLTSDPLAEAIVELVGKRLFFFDATSPIVDTESIDRNQVYAASRYDKGDPDYLNCPMSKEQYLGFVQELMSAELVTPHDFENHAVFEGCMPIEQIAARGEMTLAHGPLRPVGLPDPKTGKIPFAVVQLRKEDVAGSCYNLVGFQTRMTWPEQNRLFRMIPGLENAEFLRYGVMHKNTYIDSPRLLDQRLCLRARPDVRFAGQILGVEGYVESTAMGLLAALYLARPELSAPPAETIIGALLAYVTGHDGDKFAPMAANFGLLPPLAKKARKPIRKMLYHERGEEAIRSWVKQEGL
jgi:methylenetetrahydrofolate--tRNA-(uracil-5-)-methyltransferase